MNLLKTTGYILSLTLSVLCVGIRAQEKANPKQVLPLKCIAAQQAVKHSSTTVSKQLPEDLKSFYELLAQGQGNFSQALARAVMLNKPEYIDDFITCGADTATQVFDNNKQVSLLYWAVTHNFTAVVRKLIEHHIVVGPDSLLDLLNRAIDVGLRAKQFSVLTLLLQTQTHLTHYPADIHAALAYAINNYQRGSATRRPLYLELIKLLLRSGAQMPALADNDTRDIGRYLIQLVKQSEEKQATLSQELEKKISLDEIRDTYGSKL